MNVEDLIKARSKLEGDIQLTIAKMLGGFTKETGVGIREIELQTLDVSSMESGQRRCFISGVVVRLDI